MWHVQGSPPPRPRAGAGKAAPVPSDQTAATGALAAVEATSKAPADRGRRAHLPRRSAVSADRRSHLPIPSHLRNRRSRDECVRHRRPAPILFRFGRGRFGVGHHDEPPITVVLCVLCQHRVGSSGRAGKEIQHGVTFSAARADQGLKQRQGLGELKDLLSEQVLSKLVAAPCRSLRNVSTSGMFAASDRPAIQLPTGRVASTISEVQRTVFLLNLPWAIGFPTQNSKSGRSARKIGRPRPSRGTAPAAIAASKAARSEKWYGGCFSSGKWISPARIGWTPSTLRGALFPGEASIHSRIATPGWGRLDTTARSLGS